MRFLDPPIRRLARFSLSLSGSLIHEVHRRRRWEPLRTPAELLLEDASGLPGPALVEPVADWDMLLIPSEVDPDQVKQLAREAGRAALDGSVERAHEIARELPGNLREIPRALAARRRRRRSGGADEAAAGFRDPAEQAAWDRFLAAYDALAELQAAHALAPTELTAEQLRWAEIELEDAVAIAGELQVRNIRWILA